MKKLIITILSIILVAVISFLLMSYFDKDSKSSVDDGDGNEDETEQTSDEDNSESTLNLETEEDVMESESYKLEILN